jgi:predicted transposase YbfD/YdcC
MLATRSEKSLHEVFAELPDPRNPSGRRHALASCLTLCAVAMLCGCRSLFAIAQWGRDHDELGEALGFRRKKRRWPCVSTLHYLFKALDVVAFEAALTAWMVQQGAGNLNEWVLNLDGKTLRGSQGDLVPGVHLVAAYAEHLGTALAQLQVDAKTNEHKAALELLKVIPLKGTLITGDAAFTQKDLCQAIVDGEGDYFITVKENQPTLRQNILDAFDLPVSPSGESGARSAGSRGRKSGQARQPCRVPQDRNIEPASAVR